MTTNLITTSSRQASLSNFSNDEAVNTPSPRPTSRITVLPMNNRPPRARTIPAARLLLLSLAAIPWCLTYLASVIPRVALASPSMRLHQRFSFWCPKYGVLRRNAFVRSPKEGCVLRWAVVRSPKEGHESGWRCWFGLE